MSQDRLIKFFSIEYSFGVCLLRWDPLKKAEVAQENISGLFPSASIATISANCIIVSDSYAFMSLSCSSSTTCFHSA